MIERIIAFSKSSASETVRKKRILTAVLFVLVVLLMVFLLPWDEIWRVLKTAELSMLVAGLLVVIPVHYFTATIYHLIAQSQGIGISASEFFRINLSVGFYQLFLPPTLFGSGLRFYKYARHSNMPVKSFATIAYFKIFNIFQALLLGIGLSFFSKEEFGQTNVVAIVGLFCVITPFMIFLPHLSKLVLDYVQTPLENNRRKMLQFPIRVLLKVLSAFVDFRELKLSYQISIILLGMISQMFHIISYYFLAESIGIALTLSQLGVMRVVLLLARNLPVNILPGVGLREISLVGLLVAMNVDANAAIAMSALTFTRTVFTGLLGGIVEGFWLLRAKRKEPGVNIEGMDQG
jgi:uncharacterized protein (TIRG00374 family)